MSLKTRRTRPGIDSCRPPQRDVCYRPRLCENACAVLKSALLRKFASVWLISSPNQNDLEDFCGFVGLASADEFRVVTRSHVLAWRAQLEHRGLAGATIRRKIGRAGQHV